MQERNKKDRLALKHHDFPKETIVGISGLSSEEVEML
jgi:hypothetical protein